MRPKRSLVLRVVAFAAGAFLLWAGYWSLTVMIALGVNCSAVVLQEATSPNGEYLATAFEWSCGATAPADRIVSVRQARTSFDPKQEDGVVLRVGYRPGIELRWADDHRLLVRIPDTFKTFEERGSWRDVRVELVN